MNNRSISRRGSAFAWTLSLLVNVPGAFSLPPMTEELRPINDKTEPGLEDVGLAVQAMGKLASTLTAADRSALGEFALQLKRPVVAETIYQHFALQKEKCDADIAAGKAKHKEVTQNPPRNVDRSVNRELLAIYQRDANNMIERGLYDIAYRTKYVNGVRGSIGGERGLAFIEFITGQTIRELEATNSAAAGWLRNGRPDLALALAASMFGVADRQQLALNFQPSLSYVWVRMKKMTPAQRMAAQDQARRMLIGHVAIHEGAKMINGVSVDHFYDSLKARDALGAGLSLVFLEAGMAEQARRDRMIDFCLEVLFFQPEPSDYPAKMRLVLNRLLEPVSSKTVEQRLAANVVKDVIRAVSPELATQEAADTLVALLKAGIEAAQTK